MGKASAKLDTDTGADMGFLFKAVGKMACGLNSCCFGADDQLEIQLVQCPSCRDNLPIQLAQEYFEER